jgi:hypothetical protein
MNKRAIIGIEIHRFTHSPIYLFYKCIRSWTKEKGIMKKTGLLCGIISVFVLALTVWAQSGAGGDAPRLHFGKMWDTGTVGILKGQVVAVEKYVPGRGGTAYGLRLTMKTDSETVSVILGPAWYIEEQQFMVEPGDALEVKGSRMSVQGQPTMIAGEVKKGDKSLKLRNETGNPLWSNTGR